MNMSKTFLLLLLSHHAAAFSTPSQLSVRVAPRAISRSSGIHFAPTKPSSGVSLRMSSATAALTPPEEEDLDPLFEGIGKGIVRDYKARLPLYGSDIKDGLNFQVCI